MKQTTGKNSSSAHTYSSSASPINTQLAMPESPEILEIYHRAKALFSQYKKNDATSTQELLSLLNDLENVLQQTSQPSARTLSLHGELLTHAGEPHKAIISHERAMALNPTDSLSIFRFAHTLFAVGNYSTCLQLCESISPTHPKWGTKAVKLAQKARQQINMSETEEKQDTLDTEETSFCIIEPELIQEERALDRPAAPLTTPSMSFFSQFFTKNPISKPTSQPTDIEGTPQTNCLIA